MANDNEAYDNVLRAFTQIRDDIVEQFRIHKDIVNRSISLLNHEVIDFSKQLEKIGRKLEHIDSTQQTIQKWQWIRLGIEIGAFVVLVIVIVIAAWIIIAKFHQAIV